MNQRGAKVILLTSRSTRAYLFNMQVIDLIITP